MGRILSYDVPIFAGIRELLPGSRPFNKTIFSVVEEEKVPKILSAVEQIIGNLDEPGTGIAFTLPVTMVKGISKGF